MLLSTVLATSVDCSTTDCGRDGLAGFLFIAPFVLVGLTINRSRHSRNAWYRFAYAGGFVVCWGLAALTLTINA